MANVVSVGLRHREWTVLARFLCRVSNDGSGVWGTSVGVDVGRGTLVRGAHQQTAVTKRLSESISLHGFRGIFKKKDIFIVFV